MHYRIKKNGYSPYTIDDTVLKDAVSMEEADFCKEGYLRYEKIRKLTPEKFTHLYRTSIETGIAFDKLVDELSL